MLLGTSIATYQTILRGTSNERERTGAMVAWRWNLIHTLIRNPLLLVAQNILLDRVLENLYAAMACGARRTKYDPVPSINESSRGGFSDVGFGDGLRLRFRLRSQFLCVPFLLLEGGLCDCLCVRYFSRKSPWASGNSKTWEAVNCWVVCAADTWASVCYWAGYHGLELRERRIGGR